MGSHRMPDGERPSGTPVLSQLKRTRLAPPERAGQRAGSKGLAWSTMQQRLSRVIYPPRPPELGGAVIPRDTTAWQQVVRTSQTPAFRMALIAALSVAWIGTATLSAFSEGHPSQAVDGQTNGLPRSASNRDPATDAPVNAAPTNATEVGVSADFLRNYAKIAAELDRQTGLDEVSVNPEPAPAPALCPACTDSPSPGPEQTPNAPQATADDPTASPTPTTVEEPSPPSTVTTSGQPVPGVATQPATEQPAVTNQPVPAATSEPVPEQPAATQPVAVPGSGQAADPAS